MSESGRVFAWLAVGLLALAGVATVSAQGQSGEHKPDKAEKGDKGPDGDRGQEKREAAQERKAAAMERRDAMREEIEERRAAFHAAREACLEHFEASGNDTRNGSAAPGRCISMAAHERVDKERRADHYEERHIAALEHRLEKLQALEDRFQAKLDSGKLNETEEAAVMAKMARIDAAQERIELQLVAVRDEDA